MKICFLKQKHHNSKQFLGQPSLYLVINARSITQQIHHWDYYLDVFNTMENSRNCRPFLTNNFVVQSTGLPLLLKWSATQHIPCPYQHCMSCSDLWNIHAMVPNYLLNCRKFLIWTMHGIYVRKTQATNSMLTSYRPLKQNSRRYRIVGNILSTKHNSR